MRLALVCTLSTALALLATNAFAFPDQAKDGTKEHKHEKGMQPPKEAVAVLLSTEGNKVSGVIKFTQKKEGVHITGTVRGLKPGKHGFHIHEFGDLRSADGTSAGGHYAPDGNPHGAPNSAKSHAGDLGNITADDQGMAKIDMTADNLKLHFVIGRAIVVHGEADDLTSQPSGNAGPRVALGVIGFANAKDGATSTKDKKQPKSEIRETEQ